MIINAPESMDFFEPVLTPLMFPDGPAKGYIIPPGYLEDNISLEHPMWDELVETIAAKKSSRVFVPELDLYPITPSVVSGIKTAYIGTSTAKSVYARNAGTPDVKYLAPSSCGITNSELAREYLKMVISKTKGKVARCPRSYNDYLDYPATLYYEGGRQRNNYAYVDISSAYWTLHRTTTIDMRFVPGRWCLTGRAQHINTSEITAYRGLRHAIPGSLSKGKMMMFHYGKPADLDFRSNLSYPGVIGYVMSVMHAIAKEVIDHFGASMILTDAYIIPQERAQELVHFLKDRWSVDAVIKASGNGTLYGMNIYQIGNYKTGHAPAFHTDAPEWTYLSDTGKQMVMKPDSKPTSNLLPIDSFWMQRERQTILNQKLGTV